MVRVDFSTRRDASVPTKGWDGASAADPGTGRIVGSHAPTRAEGPYAAENLVDGETR